MKSFAVSVVLAVLCLSLVLSALPVGASLDTSKPLLLVSFDDGYVSYYSLVKPYLTLIDAKATFFITTSVLNSTFEDIETMDWDEVDALRAAGNDIESHCVTHMDLTNASNTFASINAEFGNSYDYIAGNVSAPVALAYPKSLYNTTVGLMAMNYYDMCFGVGSSGGSSYNASYCFDYTSESWVSAIKWRIPRIAPVGEWANMTNEAAIITSMKHWIDLLVANGTNYCLSMLFHHVTDAPRGTVAGVEYCDITPGALIEILAYASGNVTFVTAREMRNYFGSSTTGSSGLGGFDISGVIGIIVAIAVISIVIGMVDFKRVSR